MATISFKVDDALFAELERFGKEQNGLSPSLLARKIVDDFVNDSERQTIRKDIADLRMQIHHQHQDLITAVYVLLLKAGQVNDNKEAKAWVQKNMFGPTFDEMRG